MIIYKCPSCGADVDPSDAVLALAYKCKHCGTSFSFRDEKELKKIAVKVTQIKMALESYDFEEAEKICKKALDIDPENAEIYFLKLLAKCCCESEESLKNKPIWVYHRTVYGLAYFEEYERAFKFGSEEMKNRLTEINKSVIYLGAIDWEKRGHYRGAYNSYLQIQGYKDSDSRAEICKSLMEQKELKKSEKPPTTKNRQALSTQNQDEIPLKSNRTSKIVDFFRGLSKKKDVGIVCLVVGFFFFVFPLKFYSFFDMPIPTAIGFLFLCIGVYILLYPVFNVIGKIIIAIVDFIKTIFGKR